MPKSRIHPTARRFCIAVTALLIGSTHFPGLFAADGEPVAIRRWPDGRYSIENHWGLGLSIASGQATAAIPPDSSHLRISFRTGLDHTLSRKANQAEATWSPSEPSGVDANSIHVTSLTDQESHCTGLLVRVDGVSIAFLADVSDGNSALPPHSMASSIDVVVLPERAQHPPAQLENWIGVVKPRFVLADAESSEALDQRFAGQLAAAKEITTLNHNTFAVSKLSIGDRPTRLVLLGSEPARLSPELETLFTRMEAACGRSQAVFAKLSVNQLNFSPSNGTHTPRWNAEHMMGRQLHFFSQIYHAIDSAIPVMDLNPKQMPADYVAAHPDWDGNEEARQMKRVNDFSRRFAYLLHEINLDTRAPGSRWTLRGLLTQMERHYDDHTGNTIQKFKLTDWPAE